MSTKPPALRWDGEDLLVRIKLQPRASADELVGMHDGMLKIRVTAAPVDGRANEAVLALIAHTFGVPKSRVTLEQGAGAREKQLRIVRPGQIPPQLLLLVS